MPIESQSEAPPNIAYRMVASVTNSSTKAFPERDLLLDYGKLTSFRDKVLAGKLPAAKQTNHSANLANAHSSTGSQSRTGTSSTPLQNGALKPIPATKATPKSLPPPNPSQNHLDGHIPVPPNVQKLANPIPRSSGIDPVLLTKSTVLVRAEVSQRRQRLEKALEEQVLRSQRQKVIDQETLPDFDVTEVLKKAQDLVKPMRIPELNRIDGVTSSSDSFDENTFYSSQMDESTTTEEVDESHRRRPRQICKFFLRGVHCRYGKACTFSHDPILKQKLGVEPSQAMDTERGHADEQARQHVTTHDSTNKDDWKPDPPMHDTHANALSVPASAEREREERIAKLEAELRSMKAEQETICKAPPRLAEREINESQEESAYSPPGPDEFGRDVDLRDKRSRQAPPPSQQRRSPAGQPSKQDNGRRNPHAPSPLPNNVRVITNHIRSPVAPQPSRVSPLAVAKVPQVTQVQRDYGESRRVSRDSNADARPSPKVPSQPHTSRKRRRGRDSGEQARNVVPRTEYDDSPTVRIKEEPASPPPFAITDHDLRQVRPRQEAPRQLYTNNITPQHRGEHSMYYQTRPVERPTYGELNEDRGPQTPVVRRIASRNGQHYMINEEPDLRRVVTAPRQLRAPISPEPYPIQYSAPQPRTTRAVSQIYVSPTGQAAPYQYRGSVPPPPQSPPHITHVAQDRLPSPSVRHVPQFSTGRDSIAMAPPPRRIVVDQWGNRFMEAPIPLEKRASVAPVARGSDLDPQFEQVIPRGSSVMRHPQIVRVNDESQDVRRAPSPSSNGYFEFPTRNNVEPRGNLYEEGSYLVRSNVTDSRPDPRYYREVPEHDSRIVRMPSTRPTGDVYEPPPQGRIMRVQSVRPADQPRIIKLGERPEPVGRPVGRQVSVAVPEREEYHPVGYAVEERLRYEYASPAPPNRNYVEEIRDEGEVYDVSGSGSRRVPRRI